MAAKPGVRRKTSVPASRVGRLLGLGLAATELVLGGLVEGLRSPGRTRKARDAFLSLRNAQRLAERLAHLRGAAMKLGQLLSLEGDDLLPPEFAQALGILRAGANPMPADQLRRVLAREYGRGWEKQFARFDDEPIAAASIGQVHRAQAADGRELAIKVQYPGIARSVDSDVDNVAALLRLANLLPIGLDVSGLAAEAKRQLRQEADYALEAQFLARYRALVADEPGLVVPRVHADLSTRRVLAMDYVEGHPLEALGDDAVPRAHRDRVGRLLEHLLFRELFEFRLMQTDPNFANYLYDPAGRRIMLLDFGSAREFSPEFVESYRQTCRAILAGDHAGVRRGALAIGYIAQADTAERARAVVDMIMLVCEPLRHRGRYDFAASDLPTRARDLGFDLLFRQGLLRAPPPQTLFLHRKLVGSFQLCARIGARVDVNALIKPFLG
ncbi:MAG: AarF/ABC1/UbiB kinase family protein [Burkholderiales bacterium]|nr:AarF/ABC1/UbiB kinase family protein [Burkholderiales bacterium]